MWQAACDVAPAHAAELEFTFRHCKHQWKLCHHLRNQCTTVVYPVEPINILARYEERCLCCACYAIFQSYQRVENCPSIHWQASPMHFKQNSLQVYLQWGWKIVVGARDYCAQLWQQHIIRHVWKRPPTHLPRVIHDETRSELRSIVQHTNTQHLQRHAIIPVPAGRYPIHLLLLYSTTKVFLKNKSFFTFITEQNNQRAETVISFSSISKAPPSFR